MSHPPTDPPTLPPQSVANTCLLLARLFSHEVDSETLDNLMTDSEPLREAYLEAGGWLPSAESCGAPLLDQLAIEFCGCFLGPKTHLPPYQSVVASSRFQAECCDSVKAFTEIIGDIPPNIVKDQPMPDHAAVQLAMMGRVQQSIDQANSSGNQATKTAMQEVAATFFDRHLRWIIEYCGVAVDRTDSKFYQGLFRVTGEFLQTGF